MQIGWVLVGLSIFASNSELPGCCFSRERNESRRFRRNSGLRLHQRRVQVPQQLQPDCPEQLPLRRKNFRVNSFKEASLASGHELFKTLPKEIFLNPKFSIKIFPADSVTGHVRESLLPSCSRAKTTRSWNLKP